MLESISDCPRNFTTIQCGVYPVNRRFPQNFQMISTLGMFWGGTGELPARTKVPRYARNDKVLIFGAQKARNGMSLPLGNERHFRRTRFWRSPDGRQEIEKRSFGGPCFEGTLRNGLGKP
jgi:hypothetical protein